MTDEPKLLPCPFCGGEAKIYGPVGWSREYGVSHSCAAFYGGSGDFTLGGRSREAAIAAWNTRAAPHGMIRLDAPGLLAVIERLRAADGYIAKGHYEMARNLTRYAIIAWENLTK